LFCVDMLNCWVFDQAIRQAKHSQESCETEQRDPRQPDLKPHSTGVEDELRLFNITATYTAVLFILMAWFNC
jgi:hypothetical protein